MNTVTVRLVNYTLIESLCEGRDVLVKCFYIIIFFFQILIHFLDVTPLWTDRESLIRSVSLIDDLIFLNKGILILIFVKIL